GLALGAHEQGQALVVDGSPLVVAGLVGEALLGVGAVGEKSAPGARIGVDLAPQGLPHAGRGVADEHPGRDLHQPPGQEPPQARRTGGQHDDRHQITPWLIPDSISVPPSPCRLTWSGASSMSASSIPGSSRVLMSFTQRSRRPVSLMRSRIRRRVRPPTSIGPSAAASKAAGMPISVLYRSATSSTNDSSCPEWTNPRAGEQPSAATTAWATPYMHWAAEVMPWLGGSPESKSPGV